MIDQSTVAAVLSTARVKFISTLVVIALLLGIATEGISIVSGYYNMHKLAAEATTAVETAKNAERRAKGEADRAEAEAAISRVNKGYAQTIGKYP